MRTEQFEYLVDIYKTKSITKTAEKFYISRQVVSHAMRSLEDEIGVPLFIRQHNNLEFTAIGEIAAQKAEAIVAAYQDFLVTVADFSVDTDCLDLEKTITIWTFNEKEEGYIATGKKEYVRDDGYYIYTDWVSEIPAGYEMTETRKLYSYRYLKITTNVRYTWSKNKSLGDGWELIETKEVNM